MQSVPLIIATLVAGLAITLPRAGARILTENDQLYCEELFGPPAHASVDRFAQIDPLAIEIPLLIKLDETSEATFKKLSRKDHLRYLRDLRFADIAGYARDHLDQPATLTLRSTYLGYLRSLWDQLDYYRRTENPDFFSEGTARPADFAEFSAARLAAFDAALADRPLGPTLGRLTGWLPTKRGHRYEWIKELDDGDRNASNLSDLILGHDPVAGLRREVRRERPDNQSPVGVGMHRERLYTAYPHLAVLWRALKPKDKETFVDLGAGHGRVGMSLKAYGHGTRFLGFELLESRVADAEEVAKTLGLKVADWRVEHANLADPNLDLPKAEYYYMANPMLPSEVDQLVAKLAARARAGEDFKVIFAYLPLFAEAGEMWPDEFDEWSTLYAKLPRGLVLERRIVTGDDSFFIVSSRQP